MNIYPNAYYNYLAQRKAAYQQQKQRILQKIKDIYHAYNGVPGYRTMQVYLRREGIVISRPTVHRYMNRELGLLAVVRRRKPNYCKGHAHKVFPNLLQQNFTAEEINHKWCTDFTYLFLSNGSKRYNCTIIDLHDRSVVASITDKKITSDLAIRTLQKAIQSQKPKCQQLLLHSDQGSQYTSQEFIDFCASQGIQQSMSKAGYPYDNAPMERYYNTLKNELIELHCYHTDEELTSSIEEFAYGWYNHGRPHSYNNYQTPYEARCRS